LHLHLLSLAVISKALDSVLHALRGVVDMGYLLLSLVHIFCCSQGQTGRLTASQIKASNNCFIWSSLWENLVK
jgi:hypothetical protein